MFQNGKNEFALELKENHKVIGSLGLEKYNPQLDEKFYAENKGREIGYVISKEYWGQGLAAEATKRVIQYCFEEQEYDFLACEHFVSNLQSQRVIEKCVFRFLFKKKLLTLHTESKSVLNLTAQQKNYVYYKNATKTARSGTRPICP